MCDKHDENCNGSCCDEQDNSNHSNISQNLTYHKTGFFIPCNPEITVKKVENGFIVTENYIEYIFESLQDTFNFMYNKLADEEEDEDES